MHYFIIAENNDACCNTMHIAYMICLIISLNGSSKYQIMVHDCDSKGPLLYAPISDFIRKYMHSSTHFMGSLRIKVLIRTKQHLTA